MNGQILSGTRIAVDFWKIKGKQENLIHFLTHIHGDHIVGLTSSWTHPIYCSAFTACILHAHYGLRKSLLIVLPLNQTTLVEMPQGGESFCVTAFDANHCPGALMFYFEGKFGNILHTGDFRFSREMLTEDLFHLRGKIDKVYIDNTYCSPFCVFPSREDCLQQIIDICKKHPSSEILIGVRKFGKESMLAQLGVTLNETIQVSPERFTISQLLFNCNVFSVPVQHFDVRIRTVPLDRLTQRLLYRLNKLRPTIAIVPTAIYTGLPHNPFSRAPYIHIVPYSDHSSFPELVEFVTQLQPRCLIPVVQHSTRGPFGLGISDRSNIRLLESYLKADAYDGLVRKNNDGCVDDSIRHSITISPSVHSMENESGNETRQFSNADLREHLHNIVVSPSVDESSNNLANGDDKKFCVRRSNDDESFCSEGDVPTRPASKRKQSFPIQRKRKMAKGVVFQDLELEHDDDNDAHYVEPHPSPPEIITPKCDLNPTDNAKEDIVRPDCVASPQEEIKETISPFLTNSEENVVNGGDVSSFDLEANPNPNSFNSCGDEYNKMGSHSIIQESQSNSNSDAADDGNGRESCSVSASVSELVQSNDDSGGSISMTGIQDQGMNLISTCDTDAKCLSTSSNQSTYKKEEVCGDGGDVIIISDNEEVLSSCVIEEGSDDMTDAEILIISSDSDSSTGSTHSHPFLHQRTAGKEDVSDQNCNFTRVKDANPDCSRPRLSEVASNNCEQQDRVGVSVSSTCWNGEFASMQDLQAATASDSIIPSVCHGDDMTVHVDGTTENVDDTTVTVDDTTVTVDDTTENVDDMTVTVDDTTKNVDDTTVHLDDATENVDDTTENVEAATASDSIIPSVCHGDDMTVHVDGTTENVDDTTVTVDDTTVTVDDTTENVDDMTVDDTTKNVDDTTVHVDDATENVDDTTENVEAATASDSIIPSVCHGDDMTVHVDGTTENVDDTTVTVDDTTVTVDDTTENVDDMTVTVDDTTKNVDDTTENVDDTTVLVDDTTENVDDTTENVDDTTENVDDTTENVDDTTENVDDTTENVDDATVHVDDTTEYVDDTTVHVDNTTITVRSSCNKLSDDAVCSGTSRSKGFRIDALNKKQNKLLDISGLCAYWDTEGDMDEDNFAWGMKKMHSIFDKDEFYKALRKFV